MNEITAIIQPHTLSKVMRSLHDLPHFPGVTLLEAHGQGRGRGAGGSFKPTEDSFSFHRKTVLLITCERAQADQIIQVITAAARTGNKGDGIITVKDVARIHRIRTGETDGQAV
jgi:nitrogen regulatory protein P-II 1